MDCTKNYTFDQLYQALSNTTITREASSKYASVNDMLKFVSANIGLIKTKLDSAMQESHLIRYSVDIPRYRVINNYTGMYVGLGWQILTNFGNEIIVHNGETADGYNSFIGFNPSKNRGIVILCSADIKNIDLTRIALSYSTASQTLLNY